MLFLERKYCKLKISYNIAFLKVFNTAIIISFILFLPLNIFHNGELGDHHVTVFSNLFLCSSSHAALI